MGKYILRFIGVIITSLFFFPISFEFLPSVNSKKGMAVLGLVLLVYSFAKNRMPKSYKDIIILIILAVLISLSGLFSIVYNGTSDNSYSFYLGSMAVWLSAAYVVVFAIRMIHGYISVTLMCNYLIAVCVGQCITALMIEYIPSFSSFVLKWVSGIGTKSGLRGLEGERLFGIGAALDIAGTRFSAILIMISCIITRYKAILSDKTFFIYILSGIFVFVVGNMISRTTVVGAIIAIAYWMVFSFRFHLSEKMFSRFFLFSLLLLGCMGVCVYFYNNNDTFYRFFNFGFEGFFNLFAEGEWRTDSNDKLFTMFRFPDNVKTWVIGDGYFNNPRSDEYYVGYMWKGFYMGTDVGYLRFIYYFGLIGLILYSIYMIVAGKICMDRFKGYNALFAILTALNFIIWFKVSTDIFLVFALFLCISQKENDESEHLAIKVLDNTSKEL